MRGWDEESYDRERDSDRGDRRYEDGYRSRRDHDSRSHRSERRDYDRRAARYDEDSGDREIPGRSRHRSRSRERKSHRDRSRERTSNRSHKSKDPPPESPSTNNPPREKTPPPPPDSSPPPSPGPLPPPPKISRMDRYFNEDYDPRLDLGEVPKSGPVVQVGWDNMLAILKERGQKASQMHTSTDSSAEPAHPVCSTMTPHQVGRVYETTV